MKKNILKLIPVFLLTFLLSSEMSVQVQAAPKTMPDGNQFDATFYAATYPDVKAVFGTDEIALYNHYLLCGKKEGRLPYEANVPTVPTVPTAKTMPDGTIFDAAFYATTYPDVKAVFGTDETALYNHYLLYGKKEGRLPYAGYAQAVTVHLQNQDTYNRLMALQAIYPTGMKWDESNVYVLPKGERRDNGWAGVQVRACQAFAYTIQEALFGATAKINMHETGLGDWCWNYAGGQLVSSGSNPAWIPVGYVGQDSAINAKFEEYWNKIQIGDAIADGNHIMIVLTKENDHVTVAEGNINQKVRWGRKISKDILRLSLAHVETPFW